MIGRRKFMALIAGAAAALGIPMAPKRGITWLVADPIPFSALPVKTLFGQPMVPIDFGYSFEFLAGNPDGPVTVGPQVWKQPPGARWDDVA